jgi:hypothetical protein
VQSRPEIEFWAPLPPVVVRAASRADRRSVWDWRNEPAYQDLFALDDRVTYAQFAAWFDTALERVDSVLAIAHIETVRIAFLYFKQTAPETWRLCVHIKPSSAGRDIAAQVIRKSLDYLKGCRSTGNVVCILDHVNPHAAYAFDDAGFRVTTKEHHLECITSL